MISTMTPKKYTILGIAPDVSILPVKSLWFGDVILWMDVVCRV